MTVIDGVPTEGSAALFSRKRGKVINAARAARFRAIRDLLDHLFHGWFIKDGYIQYKERKDGN